MLNKIILWAIHHRFMTVILALVVAGFGVWSLMGMKVDVIPDVNKPTVAVFAEGEGLAAEEIERLILTPMEAAVAGAPGIERVRGSASFGLAIVQAEFAWGSDVYRNRQIIQERLAQLNLPQDVKPVLGPVASVMGEIMWAGLTSSDEKTDGMQLRTLADWTVRPALLRVPGVSDVIIMGGDVREWQINLSAERLRQYNLKISDVIEQVEGALKNRGGGILVQSGQEYPVRILVAPSKIDELKEIGIGSFNEQPIRLTDVASIVEGASPVRGSASIDGKPGIIMRIVKQPDAETLTVTKAVDEALESLKRSLPVGTDLKSDLFRQEWFIDAGLKNVNEALTEGVILVIIILTLFLMNVRATAITLTAIPMSILVTAIVFRAFDLSVNVMTLGGIAVAISELVDDAIVDVENVFRRVKEWRNGGMKGSLQEVVFMASSEVRNSIVYATLLVTIVMLPIFFIPGVEGRLLAPLGLAYLVSLVASLVISLTLTPALCTILLAKAKPSNHVEEDTKFVKWIKRVFTPSIRWSIFHPKIVMGVIILSMIGGVGLYLSAGKEGIPPFNEGSATIGVVLPVGTDLQTSNAFASRVESEISKVPGVRRVSHSTGRAGADAHDSGANSSELQVAFDPGLEKDRERLFGELQKVLDRFPEADFGLGQPITHKMEELLSGVRAPIVVKVFGDDLTNLREAAALVRDELAKQPGIKNPQVQREVMVPEFRIYPARSRLAEQGISNGEVAEELERGLLGETIGQVQLESARVDVVARYDQNSRGNTTALRDLALPFENTGSLGSAADIRIEGGRNRLGHEGGKRVMTVSANYQGSDIVGAVGAAKESIETKRLPDGITLSFEGTYKSQKENSRRLAILFSIGLLFIFAILYHGFKSVPIVIQIMLNIPTVLIGGVVAIWLTGGVVSLAHLVGFVSLAGIVSRNGIMLVSHILHLIKKEGKPFSIDTVLQATLDRLVPVFMTSASALALIPLMLAGAEPGKELLSPIAIVMFGGLASSTIIAIFLTPAVFYFLGKKAPKMFEASTIE